jgi:hypothetical protein
MRKMHSDEGRQSVLLGTSDCVPDAHNQDYTGRLLVLRASSLHDGAPSAGQLWVACQGWGCIPQNRGKAILCESLANGQRAMFARADFYGPLLPNHPTLSPSAETKADDVMRDFRVETQTPKKRRPSGVNVLSRRLRRRMPPQPWDQVD